MKSSEFKGNTIDIVNSSTDFYDEFAPLIKKKVRETRTFQKILQITKEFMTKNENSLSTNIVGKRIIVNKKMEEDIFDALDLDKRDVKKNILESKYFKETFGREISLTDQLCLAYPLILAALEYKRINKQEESDLCYLLAHFKPYASRESVFFKYPVKEGQMLYTIEKSLSERFDIKKYGTIINSLRKRAQSSYENYIEKTDKDEKYTDKKFYVTYTSGIAGSVNSFLGTIVEEYKKNNGKSLSFESAAKGVLDKDDDSIDFEDADIQSDTAIKKSIVDKTLLKITKNPVDNKLAQFASVFGFGSPSYENILAITINEIVDNMFNELENFFTGLISSFIFTDKENGGKYTFEDFHSNVFTRVGIEILAGKKPNVKDQNMLVCRELMQKMCENYCEKYQFSFGETYKRSFRRALACYWVLLIKKANK